MFFSCIVCKKATKNKCRFCASIYYCSDRCQKIHFPQHRNVCGIDPSLLNKKTDIVKRVLPINKIKQKTFIPNNVFQTWNTKTLPRMMQLNRNRMIRNNPDINFHLYDDQECEIFIQENFHEDVYQSFRKLIPGAYKADLWRYCVLYHYGGIYIDIKFQFFQNLRLCSFLQEEYFVLDQPYKATFSIQEDLRFINSSFFIPSLQKKKTWKDKMGIYNGFMVCLPRNKFLYQCIREIVNNVKSKYYGPNPLYITGPGLLGEIYFKDNYEQKLLKMKLYLSRMGTHILDKTKIVCFIYPTYRHEQHKFGTTHYSLLWDQKKIFNENQII